MPGMTEYAKKFTELTQGSLERIMAGSDIDKPIFQILGVRRIGPNANEASERYRMLVSDGKLFHSFAMLATQLNDMFTSGQLPDFSIVRVNRYITSMLNQNTPKEKRVLIILDMDVLHSGYDVKIKLFDPIQYNKENPSGSTPQATSIKDPEVIEVKLPPLSTGALDLISSGKDFENPVVQIVGIHALGLCEIEDAGKYGLQVSDGQTSDTSLILSKNLDDVYKTGQISINSLIRITRYSISVVNQDTPEEKKTIVVNEMDILSAGDMKIPKISQFISDPNTQNKLTLKCGPINLNNPKKQ